jgi:hypothetical protein
VDPWKAAAVGWATSTGVLLLFAEHPEQARRLDVEDLLRESTELFLRGYVRFRVAAAHTREAEND